jgi:arylsulfatase A-like enzyme
VRYVQLFDWGWDSHGSGEFEALNIGFKSKCEQLDRPVAALLTDLDQRGLLEDTLVIWGGEFGRTPMRENRGGRVAPFDGRDHHPFAFPIWMAGAGVKAGVSYGETDPIGYMPITTPVMPQDLQATILHLLGFDPAKLSYPFQGLNQKLTGVKKFRVVEEVVA